MTSDAVVAARTNLESWREEVGRNSFDGDPFFMRLLRRHLGSRYAEWEAHLREVARQTGPEFGALTAACSLDENLPRLRRHDADGSPVEEVVFHPAYHAVGRTFWSSRVLAVLADRGSEVASGAIAYLLDQHGEAGHACPVACTAGAIKLLQKVGSDDQRRRWLPGLLDPDYDRRLHAAQFVTELQGGSDVGLNGCRATPEPTRPGWCRIRGEKWFCSVADAGLFVVSARPDKAAAGTRGLGLFLVPRTVDGAPNGFALRRLKGKLGTRSMATGEIEFDGALGEPIGTIDDGFRNLVGIVLDTSRVHNALAACGLMRRAFVEARAFARHRRAFERKIADFPALREILARMRLGSVAGLVGTFRILGMTDRLDTGSGDDDLRDARRVAVMIHKYWTASACTRIVHDAIEVLGGNGTIEEFSILPRLYRDAIVLESWEGAHNTLCAQVLRDFAGRSLHRPWLRQMQGEIELITHPALSDRIARARALHRDVSDRIERMLASDAEVAAAHVRHVVDRMCRLTDWVGLLTQAGWDLEYDPSPTTLDPLALYEQSELDRVEAQDSLDRVALNERVAGEP